MQVPATYAQAIANKYPEQIVFALAKDEQGKCNPITLGWTMLTSHAPPMMAISIGRTRYSLEVIRRARAFVVSFASATMESEARLFGSTSGRDTDKLAAAGAKIQPCTAIDGVILSDAVANFECRLAGELDSGDHVIFVGEVVASHINETSGAGRLYSLGDDRLGGVVPSS